MSDVSMPSGFFDDRFDASQENASVQSMVKWFLENYEDPVESCPHDEGEYVFIYGGPYYAEWELRARFEDKEEVDLVRALDILSDVSEWSARCDEGFTDD